VSAANVVFAHQIWNRRGGCKFTGIVTVSGDGSMGNGFSELRQSIYRALKYRLIRPSPPPIPFALTGPVVVVGSAPQSNKPIGMDESFSVMTVNGSQSATSHWGIDAPDLTAMMFNQVEGTTHNAREVRRVLSNQRTKALYVLLWRKKERERLERGLRAFGYSYDHLYIVDRYERMALLEKTVGLRTLDLDAASKVSNGLNVVLFALYHQAPAVIITGINPKSTGHAYNNAGLRRLHTQMDQMILERLCAQARPIFTADPAVSRDTGIPMWTGVLP
jgi:hypothetical protein